MAPSFALFILCVLRFSIPVNAVAIKGAQGGVNAATGERPFRQDISTFQNSGAAWDLYILSLYQFTQLNQSNPLSYYQIAGIHGHPYHSWDGVLGYRQTGYCTHGSILFPSWHRPYMALFEQLIWAIAQGIAATYPASQRAQYQTAAQTLRLPYWDWALTPTMPNVVNSPMISVNAPHGVVNMPNPLYTYTFNPLPSISDFPPGDPLSVYHNTVRYPDASGQSQPDKVNQQLMANGEALHTLTYQLIASQPNYAPFSNIAYTDGRNGHYNSLENMHNAIHNLVGNGGHMSDVPYAAFDPIFWLHHVNVDRIFAIWQAIYPDSYITPQVDSAGTFTNTPGGIEDINTPLTPFHADDGKTMYTSATAQSTRSFGYTYPEVVDWGVTPSQLSPNVRANVNALYNPSGSIAQRSTTNTVSANAAKHQWSVNIRVDKFALPNSFFVHFYLGPVPASPETWSFCSNLVASFSVFSTRSADNATIYGQIPLTHALLPYAANGTIRDLGATSVTPLLTSLLSWRVQSVDDAAVPVENLPSLRVYVVGQQVEPRLDDGEFPAYGELVAYREVTRGKPGGLEDDDPL